MQKCYRSLLLIVLIPLAMALQSCSESPKTTTEILSDATIKMDKKNATDCASAVTELQTISPATDVVNHKIGWAQMCVGGAVIDNVAAALFSFSKSTNNQFILGTLANSLIPQTDSAIANFTNAVTTFGNETAGSNAQKIDTALALLIKAAAILAKQSSNGTTVQKSDIIASASLAGCQAVATCISLAVANTCPGGMSDTDANNFGTTVIQANAQVQNNSAFGNIGDLASVYNAQIPAALQNQATALTAAAVRCFIIQNLIQ